MSSAEIANRLYIDGMHRLLTHLAANIIALPMGAGVVMTFLDKTQGGLRQVSVWMEPANT